MKIGDTLYKYSGLGNIITYKCIAIVQTGEHEHYEVECNACTHGFKCVVRIKKIKGLNAYEYVCMINDPEDEQELWHKNEWYYTTKSEALVSVYQRLIKDAKQNVMDAKSKFKAAEQRVEELEAHLKGIIE